MASGRLSMIAAALGALAVIPSTVAAQDTSIQVTTAVVGTDVQEREPLGVAESFDANVERVYFYTVLEGDFPATDVEHVWLRDGTEIARVPLTVRGPRWRTWSSKEIAPDWTGDWEVQVVNASGEVLGQATFTIGDEEMNGPDEEGTDTAEDPSR